MDMPSGRLSRTVATASNVLDGGGDDAKGDESGAAVVDGGDRKGGGNGDSDGDSDGDGDGGGGNSHGGGDAEGISVVTMTPARIDIQPYHDCTMRRT